ncbi:MAG: hypothetical protein GXC94_14215, partial [Comamonadaceae bacterium]|nr:hypothetical protein [Comamonadaceae bacterium]
MMERRQRVLGGALAATLAATAWVATRPEQDVTAAVAAPIRRPPVAASAVAATPAPAVGGRAA